jgi:hypothetical protein
MISAHLGAKMRGRIPCKELRRDQVHALRCDHMSGQGFAAITRATAQVNCQSGESMTMEE